MCIDEHTRALFCGHKMKEEKINEEMNGEDDNCMRPGMALG